MMTERKVIRTNDGVLELAKQLSIESQLCWTMSYCLTCPAPRGSLLLHTARGASNGPASAHAEIAEQPSVWLAAHEPHHRGALGRGAGDRARAEIGAPPALSPPVPGPFYVWG